LRFFSLRYSFEVGRAHHGHEPVVNSELRFEWQRDGIQPSRVVGSVKLRDQILASINRGAMTFCSHGREPVVELQACFESQGDGIYSTGVMVGIVLRWDE